MPKGYHHLTRDQRCQLYLLKARKDSMTIIAKELKVHRSTLYRELKRNRGEKGYDYEQADKKAQQRHCDASRRKLKMTSEVINIIDEKLKMQWSPEQISGRLRQEGCKKYVSHETIYKYILDDKRKGGSLYKELRHKNKKYNKRSRTLAGRGCIPGRVDIDKRPSIVDKKMRLGDWELDTIIGSDKSGAIVSMVDRASKLTKLAKISQKSAKAVQNALIKKLRPFKYVVLTLTADNGKEFANHKKISQRLEADFYFAKPYHSWERGLNEHTNGLIRQYLPKGKRFNDISKQTLMDIETLLNNRPRKILNFLTPLEMFAQLKTTYGALCA